MAGSIPISNTRVSGLLLRQRLTQQYQADQLDLFRIQEQISTGQRIVLPSDDAPAALRAISLQRLLERKGQFENNIQDGQLFLGATHTALNEVTDELNSIKAGTLGVVGTVSTQQQRDNVVNEINDALDALVRIGNRQSLGRYLFAGSQTNTRPYSFDDGSSVAYNGDHKSIQSYSDFGVLFSTNATGLDVFGGVSEAVQGTQDLEPQLSSNTLLSSLNGGRGISPNGSLTISDGTNTSTIDLSRASTVGDVVRLLENNPPTGRKVEVSVTGKGLTLQLDSGNIIIGEVGTGTVARELGILEPNGTSVKVGEDLNPRLLKTTRLENLLGTKARAALKSGADGDNNDILLEANSNGTPFDGVTLQYVDDSLLAASPGIAAGNEFVQYDANPRAATAALTFEGTNNDLVLTANTAGISLNGVRIDVTATASGGLPEATYNSTTKVLTLNLEADGSSDSNQIITAIAGLPGAPFTATLDTSVEATNDGTGTIAAFNKTTFGSTGNSGGDAKTLYIHIDPSQSNANQVVQAINAEGTFTAQLDQADSSSTAEAGTGKVAITATATTSGGTGSSLDQSSGLAIVNGGQTHNITFENAETVEDFLNILNGSDAGVLAQINADGTGFNIRSRLSGSPFQIGELNGGQTATQLGLRTYTADTKLNDLNFDTGLPTSNDRSLDITKDTITITTSDGTEFVNIDLSAAANLSDVINTINAVTTSSVTAQLNSDSSGIELVDNTPGLTALSVSQTGADLPITGGVTATLPSDDLAITAIDGQIFRVDLSSAKTIGDAINAINAATGGAVTAKLADTGNGIQLDDQTTGTGALTVTELEGSQAGEYLGFVAPNETENVAVSSTLTSEDRHYQETDSVFNTLISLRNALEKNDLAEIERTHSKLNADIDRVVFARADVGARSRGLITSAQNLQEEEIQLRGALSEEIDVDLVEAISQLTARQISLEASLRASANILQLSLLNFI